MNKTEILQLATDLSGGVAEASTIAVLFDNVLEDICRASEYTAEIELIATVKGTATFTWPANAVRELAVFFDDRQLSYSGIGPMEGHNKSWREHVGKPWVYVKDENVPRTFQLYPVPDTASKDFAYIYGEPLGLDYPEYATAMLYASRAADSLSPSLGLALAFLVNHLEFSRPSDHQNTKFSSLCLQIGLMLCQMLGIVLPMAEGTEGKK